MSTHMCYYAERSIIQHAIPWYSAATLDAHEIGNEEIGDLVVAPCES